MKKAILPIFLLVFSLLCVKAVMAGGGGAVTSTSNANAGVKICTMDYTPVCGINGITYGNKCMAGDVKIAYKAACKERILHPNFIKNYINIVQVGNTLYGDKKPVIKGKKTPIGAALEKKWNLADSKINLQFSADNQVTGSAGCNNYFGAAVLDNETVKFGVMGSTRMACDESLMKAESDFLNKIGGQTFNYAVGEYSLELKQNDQVILNFVPDSSTPDIR